MVDHLGVEPSLVAVGLGAEFMPKVNRSMKGYLPLLVWAAALCWLTVRTRDIPALPVGNLVSFLSSYWFTVHCRLENWGWIFKPFSPLGFLKAVSALVLLAQGILLWVFVVRKERSNKT